MIGIIDKNVKEINGKTGKVQLDGLIYETTSQELEAMSQEQQAALYQQGYRAIVATYNETVTMHALAADGSLAWVGCNQDTTNLLDNPDFAIAQAGYGGVHGTRPYAADRWPLYSEPGATASVVKTENGIKVSSVGGFSSISQHFPIGVLSGIGPVTCVFYTDVGLVFRSVVSQGGTEYVDIGILDGDELTFYAAALYRGSYTAKTLPPWVAPDYSVELLKCQQYYKKIISPGNQLVFVCFYPNSIKILGSDLDVPMRISPSVAFTKLTSIDQTKTYTKEYLQVTQSGLSWLSVTNTVPISVGEYGYIFDLEYNADL